MLTVDSELAVIPNALAAIAALLMWGTAAGMFFFSKWRLTEAGRNYLAVTVAFASLLTMSTIHLYFRDYPGIIAVRTLVYGALVVAAYRVGRTVWDAILTGKPAEGDYTIVFHTPEKEDA